MPSPLKWSSKVLKRWWWWLMLLIVVVVVFSSFFFLSSSLSSYFGNSGSGGGGETSGVIPKTIWTFWNEPELPDFYRKCVNSWRAMNPEYQVNVLHPENLHEFTNPDVLTLHPFCDDVRMLADIVRLRVLSEHGGIWIDTAIICNRSLDWFLEPNRTDPNVEYVGFYGDRFTLPEFANHAPLIENWMFACIPRSDLVTRWLKEYESMKTANGHVQELRTKHNVSTQNVPADSVDYLVVYFCLQKILQTHPPDTFRFQVLSSDTTALSYLNDNNWDRDRGVDDLVGNPFKYFQQPVIRICKEERELLLQKDYNVLFTRNQHQ